MIFNSVPFFLFFAVVAPLYWLVPTRFSWVVLVGANAYFYLQGEWQAAAVLGLVIVVGYLSGRAMEGKEKKEERKKAMWAGVVINLLVLLSFKLSGFAIPLGLSFYGLATVSYTIDCYRGWMKPEPHLGHFASFVSFFPLVLSGPIERAPRLLKQLKEAHHFDEARVVNGLLLFAWGLFKKAVVADRLSPFAKAVFDHPEGQPGWLLLFGTALACLQLYADFSGYSDMAIGIAKALGLDVMENFKRPFLAASIEDLWGKRWHLALTGWMKDYVFNPVSYLMRRQPAKRRHLIILLVFFLTGLWHGAEARYLVWGLINGVFVLVHVLSAEWRKKVVLKLGLDKVPRLHRVASTLFTVTLFGLGAIVFLAHNFGDAVVIYSHLFSGWGALSVAALKTTLLESNGPVAFGLAMVSLGLLFAVELAEEQLGSLRAYFAARPIWIRWPAYYALLVTILLLGVFQRAEFIYQQF